MVTFVVASGPVAMSEQPKAWLRGLGPNDLGRFLLNFLMHIERSQAKVAGRSGPGFRQIAGFGGVRRG